MMIDYEKILKLKGYSKINTMTSKITGVTITCWSSSKFGIVTSEEDGLRVSVSCFNAINFTSKEKKLCTKEFNRLFGKYAFNSGEVIDGAIMFREVKLN